MDKNTRFSYSYYRVLRESRMSIPLHSQYQDSQSPSNIPAQYDQSSALQCGEEIIAALLKSSPHEAIAQLFELDLFKKLLPEIACLQATPQDITHHPEGDVWTHTLMVIHESSLLLQHASLRDHERVATMLGAFLHDIGKGLEGVTLSKIGSDGEVRITAHRHEELGVIPAREVLTRLGLHVFLEPVLAVVEHHMNVPKRYREHLKGHLTETRCILRTKKFLKESLGEVNPLILKICTVADQLGRGLETTRAEREKFASGVARMFDEALKN
jgi:tRNA nucleotidyltransferase/poly(A) polymerase